MAAAALRLQAPLQAPAGLEAPEPSTLEAAGRGSDDDATERQPEPAHGSHASIDIAGLLSGTLPSRDSSALGSCEALLGSGSLATLSSMDGPAAVDGGRNLGPRSFPLLAVVRLEHIKHALLLGAVDAGAGLRAAACQPAVRTPP